MSDADKAEKTDAAPGAKKKSKLVPILIAVILVLLAGGGAGGYWMYSQRSSGAAAVPKKVPPPKPGVLEMQPFVVNLADAGGSRFLRLNLKLLTWDEEQALHLKEDVVSSARIRSGILELLSLQYAAPLITPEGKEELKKAIAEKANEAIHGAGEHGESGGDAEHELKVTDVLFVEFVVQ